MKQKEIDSKIGQMLNDFDLIETIEVSEDWEQSLLKRISSAKILSPGNHQKLKLMVLATCFVFINAFFMVRFLNHGSPKPLQRFDDLQSISNELLINSTASK